MPLVTYLLDDSRMSVCLSVLWHHVLSVRGLCIHLAMLLLL